MSLMNSQYTQYDKQNVKLADQIILNTNVSALRLYGHKRFKLMGNVHQIQGTRIS